FTLRALVGLGLLQTATVLERYPGPAQCRDDLRAQALDRFAHGGGMNVEMAELPPIDILAPPDDREHRMISPLRFILERGHGDVEYGKYQVIGAARALAAEKLRDPEIAIPAVDGSRCDDGDKKTRLPDRSRDFRPPQRAGRVCFLILPQPQRLFRAA